MPALHVWFYACVNCVLDFAGVRTVTWSKSANETYISCRQQRDVAAAAESLHHASHATRALEVTQFIDVAQLVRATDHEPQ